MGFRFLCVFCPDLKGSIARPRFISKTSYKFTEVNVLIYCDDSESVIFVSFAFDFVLPSLSL